MRQMAPTPLDQSCTGRRAVRQPRCGRGEEEEGEKDDVAYRNYAESLAALVLSRRPSAAAVITRATQSVAEQTKWG